MIPEENKTDNVTETAEDTAATASAPAAGQGKEAQTKKELSKAKSENKKLKAELEKTKAELDEINDKYLRMMAEYDNFRKRSAKEREGVYTDAYGDALAEFLPISDNLTRASAFLGDDKLSDGIRLVINQFDTILGKLGVERFGAQGDTFDPMLHNAVMRTEDETLGENTVAQVFQQGYKIKDKIIRYAMVKVANAN